jgi:hypothetical protein
VFQVNFAHKENCSRAEQLATRTACLSLVDARSRHGPSVDGSTSADTAGAKNRMGKSIGTCYVRLGARNTQETAAAKFRGTPSRFENVMPRNE